MTQEKKYDHGWMATALMSKFHYYTSEGPTACKDKRLPKFDDKYLSPIRGNRWADRYRCKICERNILVEQKSKGF